jgi:hypothetical protein
LPADDRFDSSQIDVAQVKTLFDMVQQGAPYLENFIPTRSGRKSSSRGAADVRGNQDGGRSGGGMETEMQRIRDDQPDLIDNFNKWRSSGRDGCSA